MKRFSRAIIAGSLAFSLVAAAASGTAFTINTVEGIAVATSAANDVDTEPCSGRYDISWVTETGVVTDFKADRSPGSGVSADDDNNLKYCEDMPFALIIVPDDKAQADFGSIMLPDGTTDAVDTDGVVQDGIAVADLKTVLDANTSDTFLLFQGTTDDDGGDIKVDTADIMADWTPQAGDQVILVIGPAAVDLQEED